MQLPHVFFKFVMNQFLLFIHFPDLGNLIIYVESMFPCYSFPGLKIIWIYYLLLINSYKIMCGYLYFPNNYKDTKDHL